MPAYWENLDLSLALTGANAKARKTALSELHYNPSATTLVAFQSKGQLLIIGDATLACQVADSLPEQMRENGHISVLASEIVNDSRYPIHDYPLMSITGYLGHFDVLVQRDGIEQNLALIAGLTGKVYDLVLDLQDTPTINVELPPPGYFPTQQNAEKIQSAQIQIPELVGEFEKPKYFNYDPSICAHGRSGIKGCNRCVDVCPTGAITSLVENVEVNSFLCQGGGSCASVCPTGAMTYAYPLPGDLLACVRSILKKYRACGGQNAHLLIFDNENSRCRIATEAENLPGNIIPIVVEEIGSVGLDLLLCGLVYGAEHITLAMSDSLPESIQNALKFQIKVLTTILQSLGVADDKITLSYSLSDWLTANKIPSVDSSKRHETASFAAVGDKRNIMRMAIEHLHKHALVKPIEVRLFEGSPFGGLEINQSACTLCMSCVAICPAGALQTGGESPQLKFIEANCVQCGICVRGCPETAIKLVPRYLFDNGQLTSARIIHEEAPFHCVSCGKAFATQSVIARMREKLAGHRMFQDEKSMQRLQMCENCRVTDMFNDEGA